MTITLSRGCSSLLFPHVKPRHKIKCKGKQFSMDVRLMQSSYRNCGVVSVGSETGKFGMKQVDKGHISTAKR